MGNSMQSAGSFLGTLMGTGVLLITYHYLGWHILLMSLALLVLAAIIPLWLSKEKEIQRTSKKRVRLADISGFFRQNGAWTHVLILITYNSAIIVCCRCLNPIWSIITIRLKRLG